MNTETGTPAGLKGSRVLKEDSPGWSGHYSIYTVELGCHPLGVECRACGHRALVATAALRRQRDIDLMTRV
jgi:hypothetical protein